MIGIENRLSTTFEYNVKLRGAEGISFPTVIASGSNSQFVEYHNNDCLINPGDVRSKHENYNFLERSHRLRSFHERLPERHGAHAFRGRSESRQFRQTRCHRGNQRDLRGVAEAAANRSQLVVFGVSFPRSSIQDLHITAVRSISKLLIDLGVLKSSSLE